MKPFFIYLVCILSMHSGATALKSMNDTSTFTTSFLKNSGLAPRGYGYDDSCEEFLSDGSDFCSAWSSSNPGRSNNFLSWYRNGTRYHHDCVMVNGAPCGMVPDYTISGSASRGGLLTKRKVVTQSMIDKVLCMNSDCSSLKDIRIVESGCQFDWAAGTTDYCITHPDAITGYALEVPFENIVENTDFVVGRQVVLERILNASSNGESETFSVSATQSKGKSRTFFKYKQTANVSLYTSINSSDESFLQSFIKLPDTVFGTIFSNLYQNKLQPVIRYQYVYNSCVLVIVPSSETCTFKPNAGNNTLSGSGLPINDSCSFKELIKETWLAISPETMLQAYSSPEEKTKLINFTESFVYDALIFDHNVTEDGMTDLIQSCVTDADYNSNCSHIDRRLQQNLYGNTIAIVPRNYARDYRPEQFYVLCAGCRVGLWPQTAMTNGPAVRQQCTSSAMTRILKCMGTGRPAAAARCAAAPGPRQR